MRTSQEEADQSGRSGRARKDWTSQEDANETKRKEEKMQAAQKQFAGRKMNVFINNFLLFHFDL